MQIRSPVSSSVPSVRGSCGHSPGCVPLTLLHAFACMGASVSQAASKVMLFILLCIQLFCTITDVSELSLPGILQAHLSIAVGLLEYSVVWRHDNLFNCSL